MKKKIEGLLFIIVIIFLVPFIKNNFSDEHIIINEVQVSSFSSGNKIGTEESYAIQEVKMLAISLKVQGEYDENIKSTPLTCRINIDRMARLVYMDGEKELGYKYVYYNKPAGELMNPSKKGYNFVQWTNEAGEFIDDTSVINSAVDYKIYANWNIIVGELTVDSNGGTWNEAIGSQAFSMEYNESKEIPDPTRVGYTFAKWEISGKNSTLTDKIFKMGIESSYLKAIWNTNKYTLTIDPNGGKYEDKEGLTQKTIEYDSTINITQPSRTGYTFVGWTVSNGELKGDHFFMNYAGNVTLTANWVINEYEYIVYHSQQSVDGISYNIVADDTETGKAKYSEVLYPEVKLYTGFNSPSKASLVIEDDITPPQKNVLEYKYTRNSYVLTINPNDGIWDSKTTNSTINLFYQQTYTVKNPTRTGYNFTNWTKSTTDSSLNDLVFKMGSTNTTLTANWTAKTYTLTYNVNGGNALSSNSKTIRYDQAYGTLPTPIRTGYSFLGWYTAKDGGTKVDATTIHKSDSSVTLYAHWKNNAPATPAISISYQNSETADNGILQNNSEIATVTVTSTDQEEGTPNITLKCISGSLCNYITINKTSVSTGRAVFTVKATKVGIAVLEATAEDSLGLSSSNSQVISIYSPGGGILNDNAKYTDTTFDSGYTDALDGCYISDFSFTVKFTSGHNNGITTDPDAMIVYGMTQSGKEVILYEWSGNMGTTLHASTVSGLSNPDDRIVRIRFYTYSPHKDCAAEATITYSAQYTFDKNLIN